MTRGRRCGGQAALELLATVPVLLLAALLAWQFAAAGWASVRAEEALRARALAARGESGAVVTLEERVRVPGPLGAGVQARASGAVRLP